MESIQIFNKVVLTLDNCVIPNERLRNTPSARDGCPHNLEVDLRIVGCEYIHTAGILLRLPSVAVAAAQVLFQRFFYSKSLVKYNMLHVAMACTFLAAKIEENCRRIRDVANVFHRIKQKRMGRPVVPMNYLGEEYFKLKATIIKYERFLLRDLGFCVHIRHPHKLIIFYLQILGLEKNKQLAQKSWNIMNDSLRTNVFVRFSPATIACACIFLTARQLKFALPQKPPWWTVFDVNYGDIEAISLEVLALYRRPRAFLADLDKKMSLLKEDYAKKQVEIKEVALKKSSSSNSDPKSSFSKQQQDGESQGKGKESSPETTSAPPYQPDHHNHSQKKHPLLLNNNKHTSLSLPPPFSSLSATLPTGNNHNSRTSPPPLATSIKHCRTSQSVSPPPLKRKRISPFSSQAHSPPFFNKRFNSEVLSRHARSISPLLNTRGKSDNNRPSRPVISPIRLVSSGDSYSDASPPSSPRENGGVPEQYRRNYNKSYSNKNHHHHHHRRHHHHHSSKTYQEKSQHRIQEEVGHGNRRSQSQIHSKSRRTERDHFR